MKKEKIHLVWFKKDLRIFDNEAIFKAARSNRRILFFYIYNIFVNFVQLHLLLPAEYNPLGDY